MAVPVHYIRFNDDGQGVQVEFDLENYFSISTLLQAADIEAGAKGAFLLVTSQIVIPQPPPPDDIPGDGLSDGGRPDDDPANIIHAQER
jgi:hypothetical protein